LVFAHALLQPFDVSLSGDFDWRAFSAAFSDLEPDSVQRAFSAASSRRGMVTMERLRIAAVCQASELDAFISQLVAKLDLPTAGRLAPIAYAGTKLTPAEMLEKLIATVSGEVNVLTRRETERAIHESWLEETEQKRQRSVTYDEEPLDVSSRKTALEICRYEHLGNLIPEIAVPDPGRLNKAERREWTTSWKRKFEEVGVPKPRRIF